MINLTLINDDNRSKKVIIYEIDSDGTLLMEVSEFEDNKEKESLSAWINKDMAKAMISFLKQQFELG